MCAAPVPILTLNTGAKFPIIGLGTSKSKIGEVCNAVVSAVKDAGYRHIDCAPTYLNEKGVGNALKHLFDTGVVKREEIFITSKLWCTFHSPAAVPGALEITLKDLKLDYLDLYLIHWPLGFKEGTTELWPRDANGKTLYSDVDYVDTYKAMLKLKESGKVKSIGVSNFNIEQLERIIKETGVVPAVNQVELHPYLPQKELIEYCKKKGIVLTAYAPLGTPDRPRAEGSTVPVLMNDLVIQEIAKKYNKTVAQVLIKFHVQRGVSVIPKSVTPARILQNIQVLDFELSPEDLKTLENMKITNRYCAMTDTKDHPYYPFK